MIIRLKTWQLYKKEKKNLAINSFVGRYFIRMSRYTLLSMHLHAQVTWGYAEKEIVLVGKLILIEFGQKDGRQ